MISRYISAELDAKWIAFYNLNIFKRLSRSLHAPKAITNVIPSENVDFGAFRKPLLENRNKILTSSSHAVQYDIRASSNFGTIFFRYG